MSNQFTEIMLHHKSDMKHSRVFQKVSCPRTGEKLKDIITLAPLAVLLSFCFRSGLLWLQGSSTTQEGHSFREQASRCKGIWCVVGIPNQDSHRLQKGMCQSRLPSLSSTLNDPESKVISKIGYFYEIKCKLQTASTKLKKYEAFFSPRDSELEPRVSTFHFPVSASKSLGFSAWLPKLGISIP